MKVLWITPKWPFPATDGARRATNVLLASLRGSGHNFGLLSFIDPREQVSRSDAGEILDFSEIHFVKRKPLSVSGPARLLGALSHFARNPGYPVTVGPYRTQNVLHQVNGFLFSGSADIKDKWDLLVYDGLHPAAHLTALPQGTSAARLPRIIYRAHNYETGIWQRKAATHGRRPERLFFEIQARLMKGFERRVSTLATGIAAVSEQDADLFRKLAPDTPVLAVPIGIIPRSERKKTPESANELMFVGRLDWPPNRGGLMWFLERVWPTVREKRPQLRLRIAGSGDGSWLKDYLPTSGIEFLGAVESLDELYSRSILSIVPVFYGGGTRVKALEASNHSTACLSTRIGVEGIGLTEGKHVLIAETEQDWIDQLLSLDFGQVSGMGVESNRYILSHYDYRNCGRRFVEFMEELTRMPI